MDALPPELVLDPLLDAPPDDPRAPQNRDIADRLAALEKSRDIKFRRRTWAGLALSFLAGSGAAILAWALARADANGDARATGREREAERRWIVDTVRAMERRDALQQGQIDAITERMRYPMVGPPTAPRTP